MPKNRMVHKRTATTGLLPNTTNSANASYIAAGELAINLTDFKVVTSNGSSPFEVGANLNTLYIGTGNITANATILNIGTTSNVTANISLSNNHLIAPRFRAYSEFATTNTNVNANYTVDLSLGNIFNLTLNANPIGLTFSNPPSSGVSYAFTLILRQDGTTGSRTVTYPGTCRFTDGVTPVLATGTSKADILQFLTVDGGTTYFGAHAFANVG